MTYLAAPYNQLSSALVAREGGGLAYEIIAPGAFDLTKPVRLQAGHHGPLLARVGCWDDERGVYFDCPVALPDDFTGFSVRLKPIRWRRIGPQTFRLIQARLKHIALLTKPDVPAY